MFETIKSIFKKPIVQTRPIQEQTSNRKEDEGFHRLSGIKFERGLTPLKHEKMILLSHDLYLTSPLGYRIIETITDFTIGKKIKVIVNDERGQKIVDEFAKEIEFPCFIRQLVRQLGIFGEQFILLIENPISGKITVKYIDPLEIASIVYDGMKHPIGMTLDSPIDITTKRIENDGTISMVTIPVNAFELIGKNEATGLFNKGQVLYMYINKFTNAERGSSDLLQVIDWIGFFEQHVLSVLEKAQYINSVVMDVTLEGLSQSEIEKYISTQPSRINPGTVKYHNEKVKNVFLTGNVAGVATETNLLEQLLSVISSSTGIPKSLLIDLKPSSDELSTISRKFEARRAELAVFIEKLFWYRLSSAIEFGMLDKDPNRKVEVFFEPLVAQSTKDVSTTLLQITNSLVIAQNNGWIDKAEAKKVYSILLTGTGISLETTVSPDAISKTDKLMQQQLQQPTEV